VIALGATAAGVVAAGAYIRWAVRPVIGAYRLGRGAERLMADPARYVPAFKAGYSIGRRDKRREDRPV
jgi:hypothetical protein